MARRTSTPSQARTAELSLEQLKLGIERLKKRVEEVSQFAPHEVDPRNPAATTEALRASIEDSLGRTFGADTEEYKRYRSAANFSWPINYAYPVPPTQIFESLQRSKDRSLALLRQAVAVLQERLGEVALPIFKIDLADDVPSAGNRKVFVVHGHDAAVRESVARFLERAGFTPVVLHEQANQGKTIIEKFESHADVGFAVVLLTPDDVGASAATKETQKPRARQNVILELGFFIGKLGRERVCALKVGDDLELPTDILGIVWTPFDLQGGWRVALAKELEAADYEIDWNEIMGRRTQPRET